jgi:hypothetical protein
MKHEDAQVPPADAGRLETPVRQHHGGEPTDEPKITIKVLFGSVELQQRTVFDGNRIGYESRKITKDRDGAVTSIGEWQPPLCWLVFPEPEPERRPWWARLFGAA